MMLENESFERSQFAPAGLQQQEDFAPALHFSPPPIMGFDARNEVGTSRDSCLNGDLGEVPGGLEIGGGDENGGKLSRSFHEGRGRSPSAAGKQKFPFEVLQCRAMVTHDPTAVMIRFAVIACLVLGAVAVASARSGYVQTRDGRIHEGHIRFESNSVVVVNAARELWVEVPLTNIATLAMEAMPAAQPQTVRESRRLPEPWEDDDVGPVGRPGSAEFVSGGFRVHSAGTNVVAGSDSFHFVYKEVDGESEIVARVSRVQLTDPWARAGLMMRESLAPGSRSIFFSVTAARGGVCHWRERTGEESSISLDGLMSVPCWLKLRRDGEVFSAFKSASGKSWSLVERINMNASGRLFVGMAAASMREGVLGQSVFEQVEEAPSLRNRWYLPQVELLSGSLQAGYLASMDDTSVRFDVLARKEPISSLSVATLRFQPLPPRQAALFASGRTGVLLVTGEFIDGECRGIRNSKVILSSVPLGLCQYDVNSEVVAVVLRKRAVSTQHSFEVWTADGSRWLAREVSFDSQGVLLREPALGLRRIPAHEVIEVRRRA